MSKSELLISRESQNWSQPLVNILQCQQGNFPFTYLGLPLLDRKIPKTTYLPLINKLSKRLIGWAASNLSIIGDLTKRGVISNPNLLHVSSPIAFMGNLGNR